VTVVKLSLGPVGLDKMSVDEIGDVKKSNDGATMLLEAEHSAPRDRRFGSIAR